MVGPDSLFIPKFYSKTNLASIQKQRLLPLFILAPGVGFEPTTNSLTANCATAALPGNITAIKKLKNLFPMFILYYICFLSQEIKNGPNKGAIF